MVNPLLLLTGPAWRRRHPRAELRRVPVPVPDQGPSTDAVFLVLRRMRMPLVVVVTIFTVAVTGLTFIPYEGSDGAMHHMSFFDAFYFISYAATTIGFGEPARGFSDGHRLWTTYMIYFMVIGWAYALGSLFAYLQDPGFKNALALGRFRRQVRRLTEPFLILCGHGQVGRAVAAALDDLGRRVVVIDTHDEPLDALASRAFTMEAPGIHADARDPAVLGLAGLAHKRCEGVLALTNDDNTNLAIVMAVQLLRPEIPVIARANDRSSRVGMVEFEAEAVINPFDSYGRYLTLRLHRPVTHQLVTWLISPAGTPRPPRVEGLTDGRWVVCADGQFGPEIVADLEASGLDVVLTTPGDGPTDVRGAIGFVAGSSDDALNLSMAGHARLANPDIFVSIRQKSRRSQPLLEAFAADSVFIPSQLAAHEILARITTPTFWQFIEHVRTQDDAWSDALMTRLVELVGEESPESLLLPLTAQRAPAVVRWLDRGRALTVGDLFRDPDDRESGVPVVPAMLIRSGSRVVLPAGDEAVQLGDELLLLGSADGFDLMRSTLYYDTVLEYAATGREIPTSWVWRQLTRYRTG